MLIHFILERETKGAVRYMEVDGSNKPVAIGEGARIGTLYIRKDALPDGIPTRIEVEVKPFLDRIVSKN